MLPSQRSDLKNQLKRLIEISEYERVLTIEEQFRMNQIIEELNEEKLKE